MILLYISAVLLNLSANYILLYTCTCFFSVKISWYRIAITTIVHCLGNQLVGMIVPFGVIAYGLISFAFSLIAFVNQKVWLRASLVYGLLHLAVYSVSISLGKDDLSHLLLIAACVFGIDRLASNTTGEGDFVDIEIIHNYKRVKLKALKDTGNLLVDPVTGSPVILIDAHSAELLMGLTKEQLLNPISTMSQNLIPGLRLIPFHTIGKPNGLLLAYRFKCVRVGKESGSRVVAFVADGLNSACGFQALTGG